MVIIYTLVTMNKRLVMLSTHKITYEIKEKGKIVQKSKKFHDFAAACNFIREIKSVAISRPLLEEIPGGGSGIRV